MAKNEKGGDLMSRRFSVFRLRKPLWQTIGFIAFLFLLPNMLGFLTFKLGPVLAAIYLSLTEWDMMTAPAFVGLDNYVEMFSNDPLFWTSLKNTAVYAAMDIPGGIIAALTLALAMNQRIRGIRIYRSLYFIPVVSNMIAVALVWKWLYNYEFGLLNFVLIKIGFEPLHWLSSTVLALPSIVLISIWKGMGYNAVIFLAGLQGIPQHLYEAAKIDGASSWQQFWKITLPLLSPTLFFVGVMSAISSFQVFGQVYIMTEGGPGNATRVYNYYLWENAFTFFKMGYGAAMAYVLFGIIFAITLIQNRIFGGRVQYEFA